MDAAGQHAPDHGTDAGSPLVIDVDATLVTAHSDQQGAAPTFKKGYGHHPSWAFVDHGSAGTGEPLDALLRPGNAGSNTASDHLTVIRAALRCANCPVTEAGTGPAGRFWSGLTVPAPTELYRIRPAGEIRPGPAPRRPQPA